MLKRRGLYWDEFFLSGTYNRLSAELKDEALCYAFRDACDSLPDIDPMKAFFLDYRMGCFGFNNLRRFYFCGGEKDVFDMVVDGDENPMELLDVFSHITACGEDDIIPFTASLERFNRFVKYLKTHKREDVVEVYLKRIEVSSNSNSTTMKQGDSIIIAGQYGNEVVGTLEKLSPKTVYVKITNPLICISGQTLQDGCLAVKIDDEWIATEAGEVVAKTLLCELYRELMDIVDSSSEVGEFITRYQWKRDAILERLKTLTVRELEVYLNLRNELDELLWKMKLEAFPNIKRVNMNERFLKAYSDKYLDGVFVINTEISSAATF